MPAYSEFKRRLGFEYNGMILHEYYFENLVRGESNGPPRNAAFRAAAEESFGSYEIWKADFISVSTKPVMWLGSFPRLSWTRGNMRSFWITGRPSEENISMPSSAISIGGRSMNESFSRRRMLPRILREREAASL
jgi:hypothetical protein